ncbi:ricin B lectin domain-containing protein [Podospora didyma]|uniref:Ricin B lectin domain-containing protein n=1 Tax=Podospora didyma TaxID=330526 RepID=A0AAE0N7W6_9PEZI|nr:ricin B lectin domain-containing protein [Podospora didyma]
MPGPADGVYYIRNVATQTAVTADTSSPNPKLVGSQLRWDRLKAQKFAVKTIDKDIYIITHVETGRVVDLFNSEAKNLTPIITFPLHWGKNQKWEFASTGSANTYSIKSVSSGGYLDLTGSNPADGTAIINYQGTGNNNQKWEFQAV